MKQLLLLIILLASCTSALETGKGTLVIIGGGSRPESIINRIIDESGIRTGGYGIVLPMSSAEPDSSVYYAVAPFAKAGVTTIVGMNFRKGEVPDPQRLDSIRKAKLIYITGGDQNRFMDVVQGTDIATALTSAYKNGAVVAGTSAGAAVMSEVMITGNQLRDTTYTSTIKTIESNNLETKPGLGLITGVLIDQHFLIRSRHNRLLMGVIDFPELIGIGIDESTAIVIKGHAAEVIGKSQVIVIENPKRSREEKNGKLAAKGLVVNIYLEGEKFGVR
jgi:cyanophycinase